MEIPLCFVIRPFSSVLLKLWKDLYIPSLCIQSLSLSNMGLLSIFKMVRGNWMPLLLCSTNTNTRPQGSISLLVCLQLGCGSFEGGSYGRYPSIILLCHHWNCCPSIQFRPHRLRIQSYSDKYFAWTIHMKELKFTASLVCSL